MRAGTCSRPRGRHSPRRSSGLWSADNPHASTGRALRPFRDVPPSGIAGHPAHPPHPRADRADRSRGRRGAAVRRRADVRGLQALGSAAGASVGTVRGHGRRHRRAHAAHGPRSGRRPRPAQRLLHRLPGQRARHVRLLDAVHQRGAGRRQDARGHARPVGERCAGPAHAPFLRHLPAHVRRHARRPRRVDRRGGRPHDRAALGWQGGRRDRRSVSGAGGQQHPAGRGRPERPADPRRALRGRPAARRDLDPGEPCRRQRGPSEGRRRPPPGHRHRRAAAGLRPVGR